MEITKGSASTARGNNGFVRYAIGRQGGGSGVVVEEKYNFFTSAVPRTTDEIRHRKRRRRAVMMSGAAHRYLFGDSLTFQTRGEKKICRQ